MQVLHAPTVNVGLTFNNRERDTLRLRGLLPPRVHSLDTEIARVLFQLRKIENPLHKYIFLQELQNRSDKLFYCVLLQNFEEIVPLIYTPVVGAGCIEYSNYFRQARGLWLSIADKGNIKNILKNWPERDIKVIVVTDGERILGLGDLGANGMGIPVGKLVLYTACGGIRPNHCLPITLDCGTNNEKLLNDPFYIGNPHKRIRGAQYDLFIDEFMEAATQLFNFPLIQFEDFANINSFRLLEKYRNNYCTFNDDIQGTAAAGVAGLICATELQKTPLQNQRILFLGAGAAGLGIADLVVLSLKDKGIDDAQARKVCWFFDSTGLVVKNRLSELKEEKRVYAHEHPGCSSFIDAIKQIKPTCLIGVSGQGGSFTKEMIEEMGRINKRPIIFALSNPTSCAECTAEQAYQFTNGNCIFASGSPFDPVTLNGKTHVPGQGNNAYIFPGVGFASTFCKAKIITDRMFLKAAESLAKQVNLNEKNQGCIYPAITRIRDVSYHVALAVSNEIISSGLSQIPEKDQRNISELLKSSMYNPFETSIQSNL